MSHVVAFVKKYWITAVLIAGMCGGYWGITHAGILDPVLFPTPERIWKAFTEYADVMPLNFASSMSLLVPSLVLGTVIALAFGVLCDLALTAPLPCLYTIAFPLTALLAALIARSVLQPGILCSLAVSTAAFVLVDLITAVTLLAGGRSELSAIALRAVQELALSLPLLIVCHPVLAFLHRKFTL